MNQSQQECAPESLKTSGEDLNGREREIKALAESLLKSRLSPSKHVHDMAMREKGMALRRVGRKLLKILEGA